MKKNAPKYLLSILLAAFAASCLANTGVFTLYRNSAIDPSIRIHVGTFDTAEGEKYNAENCNLAATLFASQAGVKARFWCERGTYQK
jgi:hypothetical protein